MNQKDFNKLLDNRLKWVREVLSSKSDEYSSEDKLYNFKRAGEIGKLSPIEALRGMMLKHVVSVFDLMEGKLENTSHYRQEKIGDMINYLILAEALLLEDEEDEGGRKFKDVD